LTFEEFCIVHTRQKRCWWDVLSSRAAHVGEK
jgi:hypothetical protein